MKSTIVKRTLVTLAILTVPTAAPAGAATSVRRGAEHLTLTGDTIGTKDSPIHLDAAGVINGVGTVTLQIERGQPRRPHDPSTATRRRPLDRHRALLRDSPQPAQMRRDRDRPRKLPHHGRHRRIPRRPGARHLPPPLTADRCPQPKRRVPRQQRTSQGHLLQDRDDRNRRPSLTFRAIPGAGRLTPRAQLRAPAEPDSADMKPRWGGSGAGVPLLPRKTDSEAASASTRPPRNG